MSKRKICVITGSRAEYGLLYLLMNEINIDQGLVLQVVVTGMHLSKEFGNTFKQIEKDGFCIDKKVDISIYSDTEIGICESMSEGLAGFAIAFHELKPDLIVVLGDRFEIFSAVTAAMVSKIPVAHIHGGETTEGAIDEPMRHSITKMSHLHFAATYEYRNRIIQLGEQPERVFNFGGVGIDNINNLKLLTKVDFESAINFNLGEKNLMITFHPVTLENSSSGIQFQELLDTLSSLKNTKIIFTKANSDTNGRIINTMIDEYVELYENCISFKSMGQLNYLSALQYVDAVVGNSSSGLIEAPSFKIGTLDIGDRQKGRIKADSVISCSPTKNNIEIALKKLYSKEFQKTLINVKNPYGEGGASKQILNVIRSYPLEDVLKKSFYNITIK
jgi:GDP/UDP-N,N'-diacetylbacillosamine 2-epimerase (hydrolysing)